MSNNPFLSAFGTPHNTLPFSKLRTEHFLPAVQVGIDATKQEIAEIAERKAAPTFENTIEALDRTGEQLDVVAEAFFNLNSAETNDEIQALAREISPMLTELSNDILLNTQLFERVKAVYGQRDSLSLDPEQQTLLEKTYKRFARNGAELSEAAKSRLRQIDKEISQRSLQFGENLLKETNDYRLVISDEAELAGLPEAVVEAAAEAAKENGKEGAWMFTLHYPSYVPFMTYAGNRERREELSRAYASRCFKGGETDNQENILTIANLRYERAQLLGYETHAHFVLEQRMAESPQKVMAFLDELLQYGKPAAEQDVQEVAEFAKKRDGIDQLQRWDFAYYSEKLKKEKYEIDDEVLKPYFRLEKVVEGVFLVAEKLFGLTFSESSEIDTYHPDVKAYEVKEQGTGRFIGIFYADFFPRAGKRNGAWMTSYRGQKKIAGKDHRPHVSIVCNFTKPTATKPSLLTFNEVTTLFHEFGHALHGLLADSTYESLSGTSVYWDFVELPSQIMENWAYEKETLDLFASHYETGEKIPLELVERLKASAVFLEGYQTLRQVSFGKLDMAWHAQDPANIKDVGAFEREVMKPFALFPEVPEANMSCSFGHIFQGGYAAGYYSYKWAEVLDADAFALFQEKGIFNPEVANSFKKHILSKGGSEHPMALYERFRGQQPSPKALLKRAGLLKG